MSILKKYIGWEFIQKTKFDRNSIHKIKSPIITYTFTKRYETIQIYPLPSPLQPSTSIAEVIVKRSSCRHFVDKKISIKELSTILWFGYGIREKRGNFYFRNVPSAGALYPLEIYTAIFRVSELPKGIYRYNPLNHAIELIKEGNFSQEIINGCLGQSFVGTSAVTLLISSVFRKNMIKYGERGVRYILLDAGHLVQNMTLAAESIDIKTCPVGAFFDDELNQLIGIDGEEETIIYLLSIGIPS